MFNAKQTRLMNTLGIVSETDRSITYEAYGEVSCEMRAEGFSPSSFTAWLEHKVAVAAYLAQRKNQQALQGA